TTTSPAVGLLLRAGQTTSVPTASRMSPRCLKFCAIRFSSPFGKLVVEVLTVPAHASAQSIQQPASPQNAGIDLLALSFPSREPRPHSAQLLFVAGETLRGIGKVFLGFLLVDPGSAGSFEPWRALQNAQKHRKRFVTRSNSILLPGD